MRKLKLFSLAVMALFSMSMWGAAVVPSATWTVGDVAQLTTWGWASKSQSNSVYQSGDTVAINAYLAYQSVSKQLWIGYNVKGGSSSTETAWGKIQGFGGAEYYNVVDGDSKHLLATTNSKDPRDYQFYVTNCVAVYVYGNAASEGRNINLQAYVITAGTPAETPEKSASYGTTSNGSFGITGLDKTKSYKISVCGDNKSNCNFYEIAFVAAPSTPSITAFSVAGVDATIDQNLKTITATVPNDTEGWPNLTPSVTIGGSATGYTPTGAQDFSAGAINYTVTDGTNNVTYAVTITRAEACENPVITTDLSTGEVKYIQNTTASALSIEATGANLTYQWYSNTTNSTDGATSLGTSAQTDSYTPSTTDLGTVYYFCVVSSGICTTTSAITPITVKMPRTTGWVIYDGMTDESFASGSIEYNSVTVNYTVVGNSMLSASDLANRNKNNDFNDYTYPHAVKIEKHNPAAEPPVIAYVSFTIPTGYQATKIILAVGVAGGSRDIVLAKSAVTTVESTDVITHFEQGGKSDRIYDATYTPASAIAAGTYYILTPVGGTWNIFHLQLLIEPASPTALDNTEAGVKAGKRLENGMLVIEKNGVRYNAQGQIIR